MKWFYNMRISAKLITGFILVAIIAGVVGITGVININQIDQLDTKLYETMTVPMSELIIITESYQRMRGNARDIILAENETEIIDYENRIKDRNKEFNDNIESFGKTLITAEGAEIIKSVNDYKSQYDLIVNNIIKLAREGKKEDAKDLLNGDGDVIRTQLEDSFDRLKQIKIDNAKITSDGNTVTAQNAVILMFIFIAAGMLLAVLIGIFISNIISKPIKQMVIVANKIADGDIDVTIDINSKDEIGILEQAFRKMTDNLNDIMSNILTASEQVASGSKQVSDSSITLSQGATEQASSIEELSASIEEIATQTKINAENAAKANKLADTAKNDADHGNSQMKEMLNAMTEINMSSKNINNIIKVIDDIAFQTNILALNAAVEAARAGQHGKGFAVVAEEVRNLAARSANAAKETSAMIESSINKVEFGTKIANETATALNKIVDGVSAATSLMGDIALASNEQSKGVEQINQGIIQVSEVVQSNSSTSEESAAASEELSSQAELLKEQLNRFKLRRNNKSTYNEINKNNFDLKRMINDTKKSADKVKIDEVSEGSKKIILSNNKFGKY